MRNYYDLLGVARDVPADEIKRAFRKEIARYHPDKVQHLGTEFQEIATVRAADLTEAYRVLMDEVARRRYDEALTEDEAATGGGTSRAPARGAQAPPAEPLRPDAPEPAETTGEDRRFHHARATTSDFVRKAALSRLRDAVAAVSAGTEAKVGRGIDAAFALKSRGGIFRKIEPAVRLLVKFVPEVDAQAIEALWPLVMNAGEPDEIVCVLLLGGGLAPSRDLSVAIAEQRRKARKAGPVVVPVDVRDWEALFPPEAPASVRAILQHLRAAKT